MYSNEQVSHLKKLSIGMASVLAGTVGYLSNNVVHADDGVGSQEVIKQSGNVQRPYSDGMTAQLVDTKAQSMSVTGSKNVALVIDYSESKVVDNNVITDVSDPNYDYAKHPVDAPFNVHPNLTPWENDKDCQNAATMVSFEPVFRSGLHHRVNDYSEIGYKMDFKVSADQLNSGKPIFLYRLNLQSNNRGLVRLSDRMINHAIYVGGRLVGNIIMKQHWLHNSNQLFDDNGELGVNDYDDIFFRPVIGENYIGEQEFSADIPKMNVYGWNDAPLMIGEKSANIKFVYSAKGIAPVTQTLHVDFNGVGGIAPVNEKNVVLPSQGLNSIDVLGSDGRSVWPTRWNMPGWTVEETQKYARKHQGEVDEDMVLQRLYRFSTDNGNRLLFPNLQIGQEVPSSIYCGAPLIDANGISYRYTGIHFPTRTAMTRRLSDNLSPLQVKKQSGNGINISQQNDGSLVIYVKLPMSLLKTSFDNVTLADINATLQEYVYFDKVSNSYQDAVSLVKNAYRNFYRSSFKGYPSNFSFYPAVPYQLADPTEPTQLVVHDYDLNTGDVIKSWTGGGNSINHVLQQGQSAVNYHFISGYNGVEIAKTQKLVGDPDTNAAISLPKDLAGYVLRNLSVDHINLLNGSSLNFAEIGAVNQKFGKDGSIHDYYLVFDPVKSKLAVNYRDLQGRVLSSKDFTGYYTQVLTPDLISGVPAGYELASGQQSNYLLQLDNNQVTVLVKPKITIVNGLDSSDADLHKVITRTIKLDGKQVVIQKVEFVRNKIVSGKDVRYSYWIVNGSGHFDSYRVTGIEGKIVDGASAQLVTADTKDSVVNLASHSVPVVKRDLYVDTAGKTYVSMLIGYHVSGSRSKDGLLLINRDVNENNEVKFVTRMIRIELPNGRSRLIHQKVLAGHAFSNVRVPRLRGYKMVTIGGSIGQHTAKDNENIIVKFVKM